MSINECLFQIALGLPRSRNLEQKINEVNEKLSKVEEKLTRAIKLFIEENESKAKEYYLNLKAEQSKLKESKSAIEQEVLNQRLNGGEEFLDDSPILAIRCEPWELADDIGKRSLLKTAEYAIEISHKTATCFYADRSWTLIKRNQKTRTYTVRENVKDRFESVRYVAIDENEKVIMTANDQKSMADLLDRYTQK